MVKFKTKVETPNCFRQLNFLLLFVLLVAVNNLAGQGPLPQAAANRFDSLGADIIRPFDADFKEVSVARTRFRPAEYAIGSKKEKLEIRYYLQTEKELGHFSGMPHVATGRFLMDVGSNDEDAQTTVHSFQGEQLETYNADWSKLFTFQPKYEFAAYEYAQLVALYKEGRGLIWVILLFNKPPDTLDARQLAARFLE
ncbi:hypothetical protein CEQ90_19025 [Lewinellaceae bacterium SD302]|nr:hypothetical protein CEQ90_19025 [Lewinellaceae bacterium SD302]